MLLTVAVGAVGAGLAASPAYAAGESPEAAADEAYSGDPAPADAAAEHAPDNTGRNARDREEGALTSGDQSNTPADRELTQKIRRAVVADNSLSMTAHNVKIITVNGQVTLRGPVKSEQEKQAIERKAVEIAGAGKVQNQLEVAHERVEPTDSGEES
jgi:osmotically-inducible protein OsmY